MFQHALQAARLFATISLPFSLASAEPIDPASIAANGNDRGAAACSSCHGGRGEGTPDAGIPRLAGLHVGYLARQLESFASGSRASDIMGPIALGLNENERRALASFYANLHVDTPGGDGDLALAAAGAALADHGDWPNGVPGCGQCHGPLGEGVGVTFPALAGQSAQYISNQLIAWRDGKRTNDPLNLMGGIAKRLSDDQIASVASYLATLPPTTQYGGAR